MGCCETHNTDHKYNVSINVTKEKVSGNNNNNGNNFSKSKRAKNKSSIINMNNILNPENTNNTNNTNNSAYNITYNNSHDDLNDIEKINTENNIENNTNTTTNENTKNTNIAKIKDIKLQFNLINNNTTTNKIPNKSLIQNTENNNIHSNKRLKLTVIEGKYLPYNTTLIINKEGLEGSQRHYNLTDHNNIIKDTYFGNKENIENKNTQINSIINPNTNHHINDFNFPDEETIGIKHSIIKYHKENYYIKNLYGSGLFIKLNKGKKIKLNNNSVFSFVSSQILVEISGNILIGNSNKSNMNMNTNTNTSLNTNVNLTKSSALSSSVVTVVNTNNSNTKIVLKVLYGILKGDQYTYNSVLNNKIVLGRLNIPPNKNLSIGFDDENISRVQSM